MDRDAREETTDIETAEEDPASGLILEDITSSAREDTPDADLETTEEAPVPGPVLDEIASDGREEIPAAEVVQDEIPVESPTESIENTVPGEAVDNVPSPVTSESREEAQVVEEEPANHYVRLLVCGASNVGKTGLTKCLAGETYVEEHEDSDEISFAKCRLDIGGPVSVLLIEMPSQMGNLMPFVSRETHGRILVYDALDHESFEKLQEWLPEEKTQGKSLLLANRLRKGKIQVTKEEGKAFAKEHGNMLFYEISRPKDLKKALETFVKSVMIPKDKVSLLICGDRGVGKTNICNRIVGKSFTEDTAATEVCGYEKYTITLERKVRIPIIFHDLAGDHVYQSIGRNYPHIDGRILVYDVGNRESFNHLEAWMGQRNSNIPYLLLANKTFEKPNVENAVSREEGAAFARRYGMLFVEVSAAYNHNIETAITTLLRKIATPTRYYTNVPKKGEFLGVHFAGPRMVGKTSIMGVFASKHFYNNATFNYQGFLFENSCGTSDMVSVMECRYKLSIPDEMLGDRNIYVVIYDVTNRASFRAIKEWINDVIREHGRDKLEENGYRFIIIGNKTDLSEQREVPTEKGLKYARKNGFCFFEVSTENLEQCDERLACGIDYWIVNMHIRDNHCK